ncbi:MAG: glycosyl hydrolase [Bacteroidales bacterium]|nr:glycosyl hydrolase [Candidatus Sodaliphilus limicaballi]
MKNLTRLITAILLACFAMQLAAGDRNAPAPLFRDPVTDGAADPCVIYNRNDHKWYMFYTQRRANSETCDVAYCYGNAIGMASSDDNGATWVYRGTAAINVQPGHNTYWAPDVVYHNGTYHMFVVFIEGVRNHWGGGSQLLHYTSPDLWQWHLEGPVKLPQGGVIDPTLLRMPDGTWRMWFKHDSKSYYADSRDLFNWRGCDDAAVSERPHEGAKAFCFKGTYWLVVDEWQGMGVYHSSDCSQWTRQEQRILDTRSNRRDDGPSGAHGDVVVSGDRAWVFYFTHPGRTEHSNAPHDENDNIPYALRRSVIQVAELDVVDGTLVVKDRNHDVRIYLPNE